MGAWPILLSAAAAAGAGVAAWAAVYPTSEIFGPAVHHTLDASTIALTFDDGPNPACTPQLLTLLERYGAPATFFLVGRFARACPELVREISDRGHTHRQSHRNASQPGLDAGVADRRGAPGLPGQHFQGLALRARGRALSACALLLVIVARSFGARCARQAYARWPCGRSVLTIGGTIPRRGSSNGWAR